MTTSGYDGGGQFSPNGRWLAYVSNESGQYDVYVRPFPGPDRKVPVSTEGGTHPRWNRNGKELFYRNGNKMMVVHATTTSATFMADRPRVLFQWPSPGTIPIRSYDLSQDGRRFLMVRFNDEATGSAPVQMTLILNWSEELKRLVSAT